VVIESLDHALARGSHIYAEIAGHSSQADTFGSEPASGLAATMSMALANAGRTPDAVDYVSAHGPSDPRLDRNETACIKQVLGRRAYEIPVTSIKGVTGNPLAAAGPMQVIATCLAIQHELVPPTANYQHPDPECDLDYVGGRARKASVHCAIINNHGVGGTNGSMVLERYDNP